MSHDTVIVYEDGLTYAINWPVLVKQKFIEVTRDGNLITVLVNPSGEKVKKIKDRFYMEPTFEEIDATGYVRYIETTDQVDIETTITLGGLLEIK